MLLRLALEQFVIVPRAELDFGPGLNVLTGETGAGKSILVDAIGFVTGGRATADFLRRGASRVVVEGEIDLRRAEAGRSFAGGLGIDLEDDRLLLRREMGRDGRSRCFANGRHIRVSDLRGLSAGAVWIVGQGEQRALTAGAEQEWVLDRFAGSLEERRRYRDARERFLTARKTREALLEGQRDFLREEDWLSFQAREIRDAEIAPGERGRLADLRGRNRARAESEGLREEVEARLYRDEGSVLDHLETLVHRLDRSGDERWVALRDAVRSLREAAHDTRSLVPAEEDALDLDPDAIEERLRMVERICRKYGGEERTEEGVLRHLEEVEARLEAGRDLTRRLNEADRSIEEAAAHLSTTGTALATTRRRAAMQFTPDTTHELTALGMPGASLGYVFSVEEDPDGVIIDPSEWAEKTVDGPTRVRPLEGGLERVALLFRSHASEEAGDLGRIASGGELSRVLLAVHCALGAMGPPGCWVLDEVDQGIGGETANRVAERLAVMGRHAQVLLVTHLPAVAARASHHLQVRKVDVKGRPAVVVESVSGVERIAELARMLSGDPGSAIALKHAGELLARVRRR